MKIYLVQHGNAVAKEANPERPLSEKGRREVERIAGFIKPLNISVGCLWHSPKTRAVQTAEILAGAIKCDGGVIEHEGLGPNDDVAKLRNEVAGSKKNIMTVGHLPFLSRLTSLLIAGNESAEVAAFKQGGIVCLESCDENLFVICWMVTPELLG